jgi:N utilization substance protein B
VTAPGGSRHQAREAALQILYFWEVGKAAPDAALQAFFAEHMPEAADPVRAFASSLVHGTIVEVAALDALIEKHSQHWRLSRLAIIDRLILRMATWELEHERETPAAVVLDEALELARTFSTEDAVKFINGVLDGIRQHVQRS